MPCSYVPKKTDTCSDTPRPAICGSCSRLLARQNHRLQSDKDTREDIQKVFNLFDDDQTGHISLRNLKRVSKELGETMSDAELMEMIERADTDGDGEISPEEFYAIMTKKTFT